MESTTRIEPEAQALQLLLLALADDDRGVTAIEYGLVACLLAVFAIAGFTAYGESLAALYEFWVAAAIAALI